MKFTVEYKRVTFLLRVKVKYLPNWDMSLYLLNWKASPFFLASQS